MSKPTPIPPKNNCPIFTLAKIPNKIRTILGGIKAPKVPAAAITPVARLVCTVVNFNAMPFLKLGLVILPSRLQPHGAQEHILIPQRTHGERASGCGRVTKYIKQYTCNALTFSKQAFPHKKAGMLNLQLRKNRTQYAETFSKYLFPT